MITDLVVETLSKSPYIERDDVLSAMSVAAAAGMPLVAAGHLDKHPLTLVGDPIDCTIGTVSGTAAFTIEENLTAIPGGVQARNFTVYLPTPEPLAEVVRQVITQSLHLSADEPPEGSSTTASESQDGRTGLIDLEALARRGEGGG